MEYDSITERNLQIQVPWGLFQRTAKFNKKKNNKTNKNTHKNKKKNKTKKKQNKKKKKKTKNTNRKETKTNKKTPPALQITTKLIFVCIFFTLREIPPAQLKAAAFHWIIIG